ncbi:REGULATORY PROTEIN NPR3 [Salix viminalis]|uniref:REGULATORY PROTEIN NPR3 n=1 Tax=Salix viminalis TaxID=40686 RepID=A0A9Q0NLJ6_SALVM|nr:REGULATORY PROTEIN NPR3 [Salix viminalis]
MSNFSELSSSLSFTSSSHMSNGSVSHNISNSSAAEAGTSLELLGASFSMSLFRREKGSLEKDGKPKYCMSDLLPYGNVGYEAFLIFLSYLYTGKLKPSPVEVSTCVDNVCAHDACRPAINFAVEMMYASSIFQVPELVSLFQRRLLNFVRKAVVEDVIPILVVAFHCQSSQLIAQCVDRIAVSDLDNISIEKELPHEVAEKIKQIRRKSIPDDENNTEAGDPLREKRIKRIHMALDSDDVELVKLLLTESDISLDDANALHYCASYCDLKVMSEVFCLGLADVNLRNSRGYTVLHIAAMRKEPSLIVSLLAKGASALDLTSDGQSAVNICRRLTRPKDYHAKTEQGQEANKDRLCIDILEREMRRNPLGGSASITSHTMVDDLHMRLLYLENRVAFARLFFPTEAKLAMDIAHAATTSEFCWSCCIKRMEALMKTVETGRRYFPNCSEVLDKFMEDDLPDLFFLEKGTSDEQRIKRTRFMELKEDVQKAFNKDKAESNRSVLSSSSSSSSLKDAVGNKFRKL